MKTILSWARHHDRGAFSIFLITLIMATLIAGMAGCTDAYRPAVNATEIWNWYDLAAINDNLGGDYLLMTNLNHTTDGYEQLAGPNANGEKGWQPIGSGGVFGGLFDGQGHEIGDFVIKRPDEDFVGLFSLSSSLAVVRDVRVLNADVTGHLYVGGLIGSNWRHVIDCCFCGNVTGYQFVGSLAGHNSNNITNCYATGNVAADERVGGLVGNNEGTVSGSYSTSVVTGNSLVGGLLGISFCVASNCYSTGNVTGVSYVGGLVGHSSDGIVNNSFWDTETSGQATSAGGIGKNTTEMKDITTFMGALWDIIAVSSSGKRNADYVWNIVDDETYPFLSWQPVS